MRKKTFSLFAIFIFFVLNFLNQKVLAQDVSYGIAQYLPVIGKEIRDGSIVSSSSNGFILTNKAYDQTVVGIIALKPGAAFRPGIGKQNETTYPVINSGVVGVLVSTVNGNIARGDLITSSTTPGIGMKSTKSGFVIGSATEGFTTKNLNEVKRIQVALSMRYSAPRTTLQRNLLDVGNVSVLAITEEPLTVFRYIMAALVLILSIILGFWAFGRVAGRGIEALGRNPLAARIIQMGIALNVLITVAIIGAGIVVAILILTI